MDKLIKLTEVIRHGEGETLRPLWVSVPPGFCMRREKDEGNHTRIYGAFYQNLLVVESPEEIMAMLTKP